jgi:hypothetical protein
VNGQWSCAAGAWNECAGVARQTLVPRNVNESFEGDLIRPLGLVTLRFAYAEAELDFYLRIFRCSSPSMRRSANGTWEKKADSG